MNIEQLVHDAATLPIHAGPENIHVLVIQAVAEAATRVLDAAS